MRLPAASVLAVPARENGPVPGALYNEWGNMTFARDEGGYGWSGGLYWTATPAGDGQAVAVDLMSGVRLGQPVRLAFRTVCQAPVPATRVTWLAAARPAGQPDAAGWGREAGITGFDGAQIVLTPGPDGVPAQAVWTSTSPAVATVDAQGLVTLRAPGQTDIEVRDPASGRYDRWPLRVTGWVRPGPRAVTLSAALQTVCPADQSLTGLGVWQALRTSWGAAIQMALQGRREAVLVRDTRPAAEGRPAGRAVAVKDAAVVTTTGRVSPVCALRTAPVLTTWSAGGPRYPLAKGGPQAGESGGRFRLWLADEAGNLPGSGMVWSSSAPGVATVDDTGRVTLHQPGETLLRVRNSAGEATFPLSVRVWWSALPVRAEGYTWPEAFAACQALGGELPPLTQLIGDGRTVWATDGTPALAWSATPRGGGHAVVRLRDGTAGDMSDNLPAGGWCVLSGERGAHGG